MSSFQAASLRRKSGAIQEMADHVDKRDGRPF